MRSPHAGRLLCKSKLYTRLANVNFRHANIDEAKFQNCEMEGLDLGIKPDLIGHGYSVNSVSFSPDGKFLVSGGHDTTVKIWDSASGMCLQTLEGHGYYVNSVSFSPDGRFLVSGSEDSSSS